MTLAEIRSYHLVCELLEDGKANLYPDLEPIEIRHIVEELKNRTGKDYGNDVSGWVSWFVESNALSEPDKTNLARIKRLMDMEGKYIPQIREGKESKDR